MDRNFPRALKLVLKHEGGYVNNKRDPGGPTNLGVTIGTAKRLGIDVDGDKDTDIVDIKLLMPKDAAKVYKTEYWDKVRGDDLPDGVDYAVFDFAVNSGVKRAKEYLQAAVGEARDGKLGPATMAAIAKVPAAKIVNALCDARLVFLRKLKTWETFGNGWNARVKECRAEALIMIAAQPIPAPQKPAESVQPSEPVVVAPKPEVVSAPVPVPPVGKIEPPQVPAEPWWRWLLNLILALVRRKK